MISVDVVTDYTDFCRLESQWNETVDRSGLTYPFLRHEWLRTWWDCFGSGRDLLALVVRSGHRILALAPLMRERATMYGIGVRRIQFLHNDQTPRADVIVAERADEAYQAIWNTLLNSHGRWDVLQLSQLPGESATPSRVQALAKTRGYPTGMWRCDNAPYLELTRSWDDYLGGLTAKLRSNIRNRIGRLKEFGEPRLEVIGDPREILEARQDALALEASGWKRDEGTAIGSDAQLARFYSQLAARAGASGWMRLLFLNVGGRRIATSYASIYQGRLFLFKTGYDPAYAKCSPFRVLTYFAIQDAMAKGLTEFDFLGDAEPWKLEWTATTRPHDWLFVFANTVRGRLVHSAKFQVRPAVKRWLRR
jgi:CelD/BcsL family acetyltransferase involved in cellulose biosynthesis